MQFFRLWPEKSKSAIENSITQLVIELSKKLLNYRMKGRNLVPLRFASASWFFSGTAFEIFCEKINISPNFRYR